MESDKKSTNNSKTSNIEDNDNVSENNIIQENLISSIEEDQIINKENSGLYDPEENGFNLEMWNKTDPKRF